MRQTTILIGCLSLALAGCVPTKWITRSETDTYTITSRDTTYRESVTNVPGARSSIVATQSRKTEVSARTSSNDSTVTRDYPNFLRAGVIELAAIYPSGPTGPGGGLFGTYTTANYQSGSYDWTTHSELLRVGTFERHLRWFNDAPNWTLGWSLFERWAMDDSSNHTFTSILANLYIRRRIYLRDQIPYIIFSPYLGGSLTPSLYVNAGGEFHIGSFGGLNIRAYAGIISGLSTTGQTENGTFPYFAVGLSALDFTNRYEETQKEWKYYVRTTIDVTGLDASGGLPSFGELRFASAQFPLPIGNHHLWAGTSLVDFFSLGRDNTGLGVLPVMAGYRQFLGSDGAIIEPMLEAGYYPSTYVNAAVRLKLAMGNGYALGGVAGYATGVPGPFVSPFVPTTFGGGYIGVTLSLGSWSFTPEKVQELRAQEIPSTM